jgi:hypothetical protein
LRPRSRFWLVAAAALGCGACEADSGYLEVKTNYQIRSGDIYMGGDIQLPSGADGQIDTVIKTPVGARDIYVRRGSATIGLCKVDIKKNRIVTVVISRGQSGNPCEIKT